MYTAATLVLLLSACDAPKGVPSETGGGPADSGHGRGDSETGNPASGCDSADRAGGDTADPDTGDNEDQCDGDLPGVRDVKLCGANVDGYSGYDVSTSLSGGIESTTFAIGSYGYPSSSQAGSDVEVDLWSSVPGNAWISDATTITGAVDKETLYFGSAVSISGDLDGDGLNDLSVAARGASSDGWGGGMVYVYYSPLSGSMMVTDADAIVTNDARDGGTFFGGTSISGVPDVDDDGNDELLTGGYPEFEVDFFSVPSLILGTITSMEREDVAAVYLWLIRINVG